MQQLVIRLGSNEQSPLHWLLYSSTESEIIASGELKGGLAQLNSLQEHAENATVIALAPSADVLLTSVILPKNANRKILNAIPYMLEENICSDVSEQHVALGKREGDTQYVAIVSKQKMRFWKQALQNAGLFCQQILPDASLLPEPLENQINLLQVGDDLLVKAYDGEVMQGEAAWLLPLVLQKETSGFFAFSELADKEPSSSIEYNFDKLPLELLREQISNTALNLLQNEFTVKAKSNPLWEKWRIAAVLAVLALSVNLTSKAIELNQLKRERAQIEQQITQTVRDAFPNIQRVRLSIVKRLVEQEVQRLEGTGGGASMLAMLSQMTEAFSQSGVTPQTLRFDSSRTELRMQSVASNFESLEQFRREVQNLGLQVDQGAINNRGDQVVGVIVVKG
ncbi:type II secretion system protein GspL [Agaribacter flavus]|uniref:Type II secretion system protein L n=1 Tax=Agaribacter flavus TaxID=1902781 RepID=A0ABV7FUX0_9ALTE